MKNLYTKMLAVQKAIAPIEKESINPFFKSKYFDINAVIAELRPVLNNAGLVVTQPLTEAGLMTCVTDADTGESMFYVFPLPKIEDPQKIGAAITYWRRYSLVSMFLLASEDDDANSLKPLKVAPPLIDYGLSLDNARDMDSLKSAWALIPSALQTSYAPRKDVAKKRIEVL